MIVLISVTSHYLSLKLSINIDVQMQKEKVIHVNIARSLYLQPLTFRMQKLHQEEQKITLRHSE